jgi:hypothetical protein
VEAAGVIAWKLLGELLLEKGILTEPELRDALNEQERTGARLGAILMARKLVTGPVLTTILAEQVGVELERERGFGSGLFDQIARRNHHGHPEPEPAPEKPAEAVIPLPEPTLPPPDDPATQLAAIWLELEAERGRRHELEEEVARLRAALEAARRSAKRSGAKSPGQSRAASVKRSRTPGQPES